MRTRVTAARHAAPRPRGTRPLPVSPARGTTVAVLDGAMVRRRAGGREHVGMARAAVLILALSSLLWARRAAAAAGADEAKEGKKDGQAEALRKQAAATLDRGEFERARHSFERVLRILPYDAPAQRDAA